MAVISVPSSATGATYSVRIAGDVPTAEEQARIDAYVAQQESIRSKYFGPSEAAAEEEGGGLGSALGVGVDILQQGFGSAVEGFGTSTGLDFLRDYGASVAEANKQQVMEATPGLTGYEDVEDVGSALSFFGETLAQQAPQLGVSIGGGYAGSKLGGAIGTAIAPGVGTAAGAVIGGLAGSILANIPFFYGQNRERQKEVIESTGKDAEVSEGAAFLTSIPQAALDGIVDRLLIGKVIKPDALSAGGIFTRAVKGAGAGSVVEAPTEIGQQLLERLQAGLPIDDDEAIEEYKQAAIVGGLIGGTVGGTVNVLGGDSRAAQKKKDDEAAAAQLEEDQRGEAEAASKQIKFGEQPVAEPEAEEDAVTGTLMLPAPTAGAAPQESLVTPEAEAQAQPKRKTVKFRWRDYTAAVQAVAGSGDASIPNIQKASSPDGKTDTPPAIAKAIRARMVADGVIVADKKAKGGYRVVPDAAPPVNPTESYQRTLDDLQKDTDEASMAREKAIQDARRAEQTGTKADARKYMLQADAAQRAIDTAAATRQEVEARLPSAAASAAVPSVEQPGSLIAEGKAAVPITEAPEAIQTVAVSNRTKRLKQSLDYYQKEAAAKAAQVRQLKEAGKKVQLPKSDIDKIARLEQEAATAIREAASIRTQLTRPAQDVEESRAQVAAAKAKEASVAAERAARTPVYTAKEGQLFTALRRRLDNLGLADVRLVAERVLRPQGAPQNALIEGMMDVDTASGNRIISLALGVYDPKMSQQELFDAISGVMNHEVIHVLRNLGLFTDAEWKTLSDLAARQRYMKLKDGKPVERGYTYLQRAQGMYSSSEPEIQLEEAVAEMFRDYVAGTLKIGGKPKTLMDRIKGFFRAMWKSHEDAGITDPNLIFEGVRFGDIGRRDRKAAVPDDGARLSMVPTGDKASMQALEAYSRDRAATRMQQDGDTPDRISTRQPYTKRATENPITENLVIDLNAMKASPEAFAYNMQVLKQYPGFVTGATEPDAIAEDFIDFVKGNLSWLYNSVPSDIRNQSKRWYDGARRITEIWSGQYDVPDYTVAGVLAALSPQKDWYQNVSLGERVLDIHTRFTRGNEIAFTSTPEMADTAARIYSKADYAGSLINVLNKPYAELGNETEQAMWLRIYDETYNPRGFRTVSAEGDFVGDPKGNVAWGSNNEIAKAIYVLKNQNRESTSYSMGGQHKVRNFFNNILAPNAPHGDVTIDTHAVAAALIRPLSGSSMEVHHNFGSSPENKKKPANWVPSKSVGDSGASGMYGIYAEAYRRAADDLGVLPRELQSITWEAVRGLFPAVDKRNKAKSQSVNDQWVAVSEGRVTPMEARENISKIMGGINDPTWYGLDYTTAGSTAPSSYEGELAVSRINRGYQQSVGGASGGDAAGDRGAGARAAAPGSDVFVGAGGPSIRRRETRQGRYSLVGGDAAGRGRGDGGRGRAVRGAPPLEGAPRVQGASGPDQNLVLVAEKYARDNGIDLRRQGEYVEVNEELATRTANAFEEMKHDPQDPKVREAYAELIRQTRAQYDALADAGYKFWFIDKDANKAYASTPWNAMRDIRKNKTMGVFPSVSGFGTREEVDVSQNPLLEETDLMWPYGGPDGPKVPVLANDLFRAVHDAFGHGIEGSGFRARGEENAWQAHIRLFTGLAKGALTTETRGQNSWLNYGPFGEQNRKAKVEDTIFADQKVGLMPEWTWKEGLASDGEAYSPDQRLSIRYAVSPITPAMQKKIQANQQSLMYASTADVLSGLISKTRLADRDQAKKFTDGVLRRFQDSMLPIGRMIQELSAKGLTITDAMDTYLQENLMHGKVGERIRANKAGLYDPVAKAIKRINVPKARIDQLVALSNAAAGGKGYVSLSLEVGDNPSLVLANAYLYAAHARERNRYIKANKDKANNSGSGMGDAEASAIIQWFASLDPANSAAIADLEKGIRLIVADTNQTRVDGGLISSTVVDPYNFYVPLRGLLDQDNPTNEDDSPGNRTTPGLGARGREDRRTTGRYDYAADVVANVFAQNSNAIVRAERNKVGQSFLGLLRADPSMTDAYAEVLPYAPKIKVSRGGKMVEVPDPKAYDQPDILVVKEDGKETFVRFVDTSMAGAMNGKNGLSVQTGRGLIGAMAKINRYLATINTSYNPEFIITNMIRDLTTAGVQINQFEMEGLTSDALSGVPSALKGITRSIRDNDNSSEWAKVYREFVEAGGQNSTNQMNSIADYTDDIASMLGDISQSGIRGKWASVKNGFVGKGVGSVLNFLEDYNTVVENGIRVSTYKALIDRGVSKDRAAQAARNVTVNFAKRGDYGQLMGAFYLFYNASIQGSFALLNAATRSKKVQKILLGVAASGFVLDAVNGMLSGEDEDGERIYDKIPDHVLEHNLVIMDFLGVSDRGYITIPLPYGINLPFNTGRALSRYARGGYTMGETGTSITSTLLDVVNPLGGTESFENFAAPTVLDPIIDVIGNEDFAGKPIYKEGLAFDRTPAPVSQLYWSTTSPSAIWIANNLNSLTGGNEVRPGLVDMSPDIIQFWFEFVTGGIGRFAMNTAEVPFTVVEEGITPENIRNIPFVKKVVGSVSEREDMTSYIEGAKQILTAGEELKRARESGDREWAKQTIGRYGAELRLVGPIKSIESNLRKISKMKNDINRSTSMPEAQKKVMLERLEERRQMLLSRANKLIKDAGL
jgi:hypothetical protein